ncbi:MAG TPA: SdpI family protein [Croceibacterium sp.]|nr:SdpI family protein [Croceibacterium sp.]
MTQPRAPWLLVMAPLLFAMISVPLVLGMVEPNSFYGVRTAATRASEAAWYRANAMSGLVGLFGGLAGFGINVLVMRSNMRPPRKIGACLAVLIILAAMIVTAGIFSS